MSHARLTQLADDYHLPHLAERIDTAMAAAAAPQTAAAHALTLIDTLVSSEADGLQRLWSTSADSLLRVLQTLCGAAPFFVQILQRHPKWLLRLAAEDLTQVRTTDWYHSALADVLERTDQSERSEELRRFKYYELARITVRDLSHDLVPLTEIGETLREVSSLAEALLAHALKVAMTTLARTYGPPIWQQEGGEKITLPFVVLGLGKLGARELNYSSDVDLIYVYEEPSPPVHPILDTPGVSTLPPVDYFTRLAQEFGKVVGTHSPEGFLYRIDLDLRPEGNFGPLIVSHTALADYYDSWADTWEKATFMKARPVAGALAFGWQTIRALDPMIYRTGMDYSAVEAIKTLREKVEKAKAGAGKGFHVKIGSGGIRSIETITQALQLLHGSRIPQIRTPSTEMGLIALTQVGLLSDAAGIDLLAAYRFFRRLENRLQMESERQTHRLPTQHEALERLARSLGFTTDDPEATLHETIARHRDAVQRIEAHIFPTDQRKALIETFSRYAPALMEHPIVRPQLETLAHHISREIAQSSNSERALNNLDRFLAGIGARRFYYELLLDRSELIPRLVRLFANSNYLSGYLARYPLLIEPIFYNPEELLLSTAALELYFTAIHQQQTHLIEDPTEAALEALRLFHHREVCNVGLLELSNTIPPADANTALTDIAQVCLTHALDFAQQQLQHRYATLPPAAQAGQFLVVGMGKLASRELTHGSDLDVIFLYAVGQEADSAVIEAQEYFVRLAQKLISILQMRTINGVCYDIDARLRPSGSQGLLVTDIDAFTQYHATSAQVWERQALLRARPVAGHLHLAQQFDALRLDILRQPLPTAIAPEIHRLRMRTETELAREVNGRRDFKTGRGGMHDVESIVQLLQLQHGTAHPVLFEVTPIPTQIDHLDQLGLLDSGDAEMLRQGWAFLQHLSSRLRIVENRSISELDAERGDLDSLAQGMGYQSTQRASALRRAFLNDYRRHTEAIRSVYHRVFDISE